MSGGSAIRQIIAPLAPLRRDPHSAAALDTEALIGERASVAEDDVLAGEGWAYVTLLRDGYTGYVPLAALGEPVEPTHRIIVPRTFVFPGPSIKLPPVAVLPLNGEVAVLPHGDEFLRVRGEFGEGFLYAAHLAPVADRPDLDFVAVAERFQNVPYLWGGKSALGIDCSGLVQLSLAATGVDAPRDSGPQSRTLGQDLSQGQDLLQREDLPRYEDLRRGDLAFWPGHVGILQDADTLLHANGHHMLVVSEPLADAVARIRAATGHEPSFRRLAL